MFNRLFLAVAIWFVLLAGSVDAQRVPLSQLPSRIQTSASQTVVVRSGPNKGSGTYLGDGLYLTADHVMRDGEMQGGVRVGIVTFLDGRTYRIKQLAGDPNYDQAILESTEKPAGGVPLASANARVGSKLWIGGYSQGACLFWPSMVRHYSAPVGNYPADWINTSGQSIPGDSGGSVFNENGELIGPLWGGGNGETVASNCGRTQRFLLPWNARLAAWQQAGNGCFGGSCPPQQGSPSGGVPIDTSPQRPPTEVPLAPLNPSPPSQSPAQPVLPNTPGCLPCKADYDEIAKQVWDKLKDKEELRGPKGEKGDKGDGVSEEQIAAIVIAISNQIKNDPAMRGPQGEPGPRGEPGPAGVVDEADIERIKADVLAPIPPRSVMLVDLRTAEVIDNETFAANEPIVIDVGRITPALIDAIKKQVLAELPGQRVLLADRDTKTLISDKTYPQGEAIVIELPGLLNPQR